MWENWEIIWLELREGQPQKIFVDFSVDLPIMNDIDTFWILINILQIRWQCTLKILFIYQNSWQLLHYWWIETLILTCVYEVIFDQRRDKTETATPRQNLKSVHISKKMCNCQSFQLVKLFSHFRNYRRQF